MKRSSFSVTLTVVLALVLILSVSLFTVACSGGDEDTKTSETTAAAQTFNLKLATGSPDMPGVRHRRLQAVGGERQGRVERPAEHRGLLRRRPG